jgi:hypothetical protein
MQLGLSPAERSVIRDAVRLGRTCAYPLEGTATALMHTDASTASASRPRPPRQALHSMPVKAQGCQPDYCNHLCRSRYVQLRVTHIASIIWSRHGTCGTMIGSSVSTMCVRIPNTIQSPGSFPWPSLQYLCFPQYMGSLWEVSM